jgi:hypothetical protein
VSRRPLVFVSALTVGDYLLWNWSLNGNHDVLALVAGLTLPPLALACAWLLALGLARLIARAARRRPAVPDVVARRSPAVPSEPSVPPTTAEQLPGTARTRRAPSRKIAA